ncbi:MAG: type II secretion system F family protein [Selenomonadaceae bacterium]|nr:type II secretion system F family protein [Selenomonadaceae bacterium]
MKIIILTSLFVALIVIFLSGVLYLYLQNKPEAQLRKRLNEMIEKAESERAKKNKTKNRPTQPETSAMPNTTIVQNPKNPNTFFERVIRPIILSLEERFQKLTPNEIKLQLEDKIFRAGKMGVWDVKRFVTIWCLSIAVFTLIAFFGVQFADLHPLQRIFLIVLGFITGAAMPFLFLNSQIIQRQKNIRRQLPEFLDILCVSVQAGLSFDGAVGKMIRRMKGPLIDEFRRAQNDVALGMTHQYALSQLARRCDIEEVYLFTTSIIQAEKLGTSMTRTLQMQADNMRERHRQFVKAEALKAPVKIIFPMVLFIFPSIFVVLLFPALLTLMRSMGGGG